MQTRSVQKLWEAKAPAVNRVVPRNMILSADEKHLFLLGYPEYLPNSTLQLYRLSVRDGECEAVGDSIPIVSEEIATNANLYFNEELNEFYMFRPRVREARASDYPSILPVCSAGYIGRCGIL